MDNTDTEICACEDSSDGRQNSRDEKYLNGADPIRYPYRKKKTMVDTFHTNFIHQSQIMEHSNVKGNIIRLTLK